MAHHESVMDAAMLILPARCRASRAGDLPIRGAWQIMNPMRKVLAAVLAILVLAACASLRPGYRITPAPEAAPWQLAASPLQHV
jgi:hypothetical protein